MAVKMSRVVKQLFNVLKLFRVTACCIHSFRIRSKETLRIMYPKYPVLDMIRRIHLRCGSFGSIHVIRFWILEKKRNICLRIKIRIWILMNWKRTLISLFFRTTKFIYSHVSSTQRPRYHGIVKSPAPCGEIYLRSIRLSRSVLLPQNRSKVNLITSTDRQLL